MRYADAGYEDALDEAAQKASAGLTCRRRRWSGGEVDTSLHLSHGERSTRGAWRVRG
jgi:hypothetical protein